MEQLSIGSENESDSEFSELGDVLYPGLNQAPNSTDPTNADTFSEMQCDSLTLLNQDAPPDPNTQYKSPSESDGGASE